jgi:hypothetical protein
LFSRAGCSERFGYSERFGRAERRDGEPGMHQQTVADDGGGHQRQVDSLVTVGRAHDASSDEHAGASFVRTGDAMVVRTGRLSTTHRDSFLMQDR